MFYDREDMCSFSHLFFVCLPLEGTGDHGEVRNLFLRTSIAVTGEAAPRVLCSVLGPSLPKGHWHAGACPMKGREGHEGSRKHVWWVAEGAVGVHLEKRNLGGILRLSTSKEDLARWGSVSFAVSQVKGCVLRASPQKESRKDLVGFGRRYRDLWVFICKGTLLRSCPCVLKLDGRIWIFPSLSYRRGDRSPLFVLSHSLWKIHG